MSAKMLIIAAVLGAGIYAVSRVQPPVATASGAVVDSAAVQNVSFKARLKYSVGAIGSAIVGTSVRRNVEETEQSLHDMHKAIKATGGMDGARARELANKITYMDSVAVEDLHMGRPIKALKTTMEAKNLLNAVRVHLKQRV
jgi:hypothetical protein